MDRWEVPARFRRHMVVAARQSRREATRSEVVLWKALRTKQVYGCKFRRQQPVEPFMRETTFHRH